MHDNDDGIKITPVTLHQHIDSALIGSTDAASVCCLGVKGIYIDNKSNITQMYVFADVFEMAFGDGSVGAWCGT